MHRIRLLFCLVLASTALALFGQTPPPDEPIVLDPDSAALLLARQYLEGGPGSRAAMQPSQPKITLVSPEHPLSARFDGVGGGQPPGTYLAVLERSPFWQAGATDVIEHESVHVVLGLLEQLP